MQALDFELNGGVTSSTVVDKNGGEQVVRKQNTVRGRVIVRERDIVIEVQSTNPVDHPPLVVAELVEGELRVTGNPLQPDADRPPAQMAGTPTTKDATRTWDGQTFEPTTELEAGQRDGTLDRIPATGETEEQRLNREVTERLGPNPGQTAPEWRSKEANAPTEVQDETDRRAREAVANAPRERTPPTVFVEAGEPVVYGVPEIAPVPPPDFETAAELEARERNDREDREARLEASNRAAFAPAGPNETADRDALAAENKAQSEQEAAERAKR